MLYFIAIVAPDTINQQVLEWKNYMLQQFNCKVALKSPAHITLIPPFQMPDSVHTSLQELLLPFAARQPNFSIQVKDFGAFKPRVIYASVQPNARLGELRSDLEAMLLQDNRFPVKKEDRPFHPHITIANRDLTNDHFPLAWQHFQPMHYEVIFPADAISLLRHNSHAWEIAGAFPFNQ